jgi:hypothetical protein
LKLISWRKYFFLTEKFPEAKLFATNYLEIYSKTIALPKNKHKNEKLYLISLKQVYVNLYCPSSLCVEKLVFEEMSFNNDKLLLEDNAILISAQIIRLKLAYSHEDLW